MRKIPLLQELSAEEPDNPYFAELTGQILFENGKIEPALKAYKTASELLPDGALIQIDYAHVLIEYAKGQGKKSERNAFFEEAIAALQQAKQYEARNPRLYHFLGVAYGAQGREGYARLSLAEEAVLRNKMEDAQRQLSYAEENLPKDASQARLRVQDLRRLIEQRTKNKEKK